LRIGRFGALPSASNLQFDGGILEIGYSDPAFNRDIGTGAGEVRWLPNASGGFSSALGTRTVTLNGEAQLTWGQGGFIKTTRAKPLLLSSRYARGVIDFTNPIHSPNAQQDFIHVARGMNTNAYAVLSGNLTGVGSNPQNGLYQTGPGLLWLTGENTFPNKVGTFAGALGGNIPYNSKFDFSMGVYMAHQDVFRNISGGHIGNNVEWYAGGGGGGFAAYAGDILVRLNNSTTQVTWGTFNFVRNHQTLIFGHYMAKGTILWDKQLGLGTDLSHLITVERGIAAKAANRADVSFTQALSGSGGSLTIQGDGRMDIAVDNPDLQIATININGAELRLQQDGRIAATATNFFLKNGGTLTLDNLGTHKSATGGKLNEDRINDDSNITLNASTLRYMAAHPRAFGEAIGTITLEDGANTIEVSRPQGSGLIALVSQDFLRSSWVGTFNLIHESVDEELYANNAQLDGALFAIDNLGSEAAWKAANTINDYGGVKIAPWATTNGQDWLTTETSIPITGTLFSSLQTYQTGAQNTWAMGDNVALTSTQTLSASRLINSLKIVNRHLVLGGHTLTIESGGLLTYTNGNQIRGTGTVTTGGTIPRPLYIHAYGHLTINQQATLNVLSLVKTGPASLVFNSKGTHSMRELYIHQGKVQINYDSTLNVAGKIVIGDGAGKDILRLPANRWNPITGNPDVTLRGTPYGPGAEYFSYNPDEAILQMGGNTKQTIGTLRIEDRGTIDWIGGEVGKANMLFVDKLEFNNKDARLFMRNWYEYEDYLLVKKVGFDFGNLGKIVFDGLWDLPALAVHYDAQYYMITPYNSPEPSTYGAILGAVGIGLWTWRRRRAASGTHVADKK